MSWQAYVDTSLVGTGCLDKGAIIAKEGNSVWAISQNFQIEPEEMSVLAAILGGKGDRDAKRESIYQNGLYIGGAKYILTNIDDRSLYAHARSEDGGGVTATLTEKTILIGHYTGQKSEGVKAGDVVAALAQYLITLGF